MKREEVEALERRIAERARSLWEAEGSPEGREADYLDLARELVAIEDTPDAATMPVHDPRVPDAEPMLAVENQGEFPGLDDEEDTPYAFAQGRLRWADEEGEARNDAGGGLARPERDQT